jgi:branched-chain amino acid transport system substrate-binding protein
MSGPSPAALALALAVAACGRPVGTVGLGVALSSVTRPGVELAAAEINAAGGLDGRPLRLLGLEAGEGSYRPEEILAWAHRFAATADLVAVVGHSDSASTLSGAAAYNQLRVPQIVTIATNPAITAIGDWTYRLCLSDALQGPALAEYAVGALGSRSIAVVYVNDDYGRGLARLFERRVRELGGTIVGSVFHRNMLEADDRRHLAPALARILAEGRPDLVALFQRVDAGNWTVGALREAGFEGTILGGDSLGRASFVEERPEAKEGILLSQFFLAAEGGERARRFVEAFRRFAGREPDYGDAFAYDAVYLVRDAVLSGGPSRREVKAYFDRLIARRTPVAGAAGSFVLAPDHDARRPFFLSEIRGGRLQPAAVLRCQTNPDTGAVDCLPEIRGERPIGGAPPPR